VAKRFAIVAWRRTFLTSIGSIVEMWEKVWKTFDCMFKGSYEYRIDAKGRLPVPAAFRRLLEHEGQTTLVATALDQCLGVYTSAEWSRLERQLISMPSFEKSAKALTRRLASQAADCAIDQQGRILLPPILRRATGLEKAVVIVGVLNRFEIWAPDAWARFLQESEHLLDGVALPPSTSQT
jgi:MraZ protein